MAWEDQILINMVNQNIHHYDFLKKQEKLIDEKNFIFKQVVNFLNGVDKENKIPFKTKSEMQSVDTETTETENQLPFSVVMPILVFLERSILANNKVEKKDSLKNIFILSTFEAMKFTLDEEITANQLFWPGYSHRATFQKETDFLNLIHHDLSVKTEDVLKIFANYGDAEIVKKINEEIKDTKELKENPQLQSHLYELAKDFDDYKKIISSETFQITHPSYDEQTIPLIPIKFNQKDYELSEAVLGKTFKSETEKIDAISAEIKGTITANPNIHYLLDLFKRVQSNEFDFLRVKQTSPTLAQSNLGMFTPPQDAWEQILTDFKKKVIYLAERDSSLVKNISYYQEIINTDGSNHKDNKKYKGFLDEVLEEKKNPRLY